MLDQKPSAGSPDYNLAVLNWIGTLFFGFLVPLVMFLAIKDDRFLQENAKEALNWSITAAIGLVISGILTVILIGALGFAIISLAHLVFCIMGAVQASKGELVRLPFVLRLIK